MAEGRTTRTIAIVAIVLAVVGVALAATRFLTPSATSCQDTAWSTVPAKADLPADWELSTSQFDINRQQATLVGPAPADETTNQGVVYATITCFPAGATEAVGRSERAARDAGQTVVVRDDLGDGGFVSTDQNGATFLQLRHGAVVTYLAASADVSGGDVDQLASAYDKAMGGDGGAVSLGTPDAASTAPSDEASDPAASDEAPSAAAAPKLEALLPSKVGDVAMTINSALGADVLAEDQASRAIIAALRADGKTPDDLTVAQAFDDTGAADLSILVTAVDGLSGTKLKAIMLDSWLAASGAGVVRNTVTLDGRTFTRVDYGDGKAKDYLLVDGDSVLVITTSSADLAKAAATALP